MLTAPVAVMAASALQALWQRLPTPTRRVVLPLALVPVLVLVLSAASAAVEFKLEVLHHPLMSDADKHELRLGTDRYQTALFLRTLPAASKVWTQDLLLPFQADGMRMTVGLWPTGPDQLTDFDYWVLSGSETLPDWFGVLEPIHRVGAYRVYALPKR